MYTSPARICVSADGELCDETDPRAVRLLVAEGGQIPASEAAKYGLIDGGPQAEAGAAEAGADREASPGSAAAAGDVHGHGAPGKPAAEETPLRDLTAGELREHAQALGLDLSSRATKAEIIAALEEASAASGEANGEGPGG